MKAFLQEPTQGVVLQSYGAGNVPSNRRDLLEALLDATRRGVIIVNCTQCSQVSGTAASQHQPVWLCSASHNMHLKC